MTIQRAVLVVGIGAGNPDHMTVQAIEALNRADVIFIPGKGSEKADLAQARRTICDRFIRTAGYRAVTFDVPRRAAATQDYRQTVDEWHDAIAATYADLLTRELADQQCGAFLVWGDPSLYDSTLRILDRVRTAHRIALDIEVIPGITSVQTLAAQHKVVLNAIGEPVIVTTGRRLAEGWPEGASSVVVMLTAGHELRTVAADVDVFWGAYLGTADEILIEGRLRDVIDIIERSREEARRRKGWIMDTALLKRRVPSWA